MNNKKGFTLVELLVVIALIGLLVVIAVPSALTISNKVKQNMLEKKIEIIESEAILWGQNNKSLLESGCIINGTYYSQCYLQTVNGLLEQNAIKEDRIIDGEKVLINPVTNETLNGCNVHIYIKNKRVYASYEKTGLCHNSETEDVINPLKEYILITTDISSPPTYPGMENSKFSENVLAKTQDNYGDTYYYRGNVKNNYVTFANMCWRIVRIAGDGSIKLILEDQDQTCSESMDSNWSIGTEKHYGYTYVNNTTNNFYKANFLNPSGSASSMVTTLKSFQSNKLSSYFQKLKSGDWCLNTKAYSSTYASSLISDSQKQEKYKNLEPFFYGSYVTRFNPSLKCDNESTINYFKDGTKMYVGALTAEEVIYAGFKWDNINTSTYLGSQGNWWLLSLAYYEKYYSNNIGYDRAFLINNKKLSSLFVLNRGNLNVRPAISLADGITFKTGGDGTISKPYVVK